jgi:hypothetical protein
LLLHLAASSRSPSATSLRRSLAAAALLTAQEVAASSRGRFGGYSCVIGTPPSHADGPGATTSTARGDHVDAKAGLGATDGESAAVVRREQFDVLAKLPAIDLVLDSVVGEMNVVIESTADRGRALGGETPLVDFIVWLISPEW